MEEITLEQEKFDTVKELVDLQTNISNGRAVLKELQEKTEEFLVTREIVAKTRVLKILKESHDALEEINENHKELTSYSGELQAFVTEIKQMSSDLTTLFKDFNEKIAVDELTLVAASAKMAENLRETKLARVELREDKLQLGRDRERLNNSWTLLGDREKTLKQGFEELNSKQK